MCHINKLTGFVDCKNYGCIYSNAYMKPEPIYCNKNGVPMSEMKQHEYKMYLLRKENEKKKKEKEMKQKEIEKRLYEKLRREKVSFFI